MASVSELEQHGKMVFLLGTHSMDFIPTKLDVHAFEGKMTAYALVVFQIPCQTEVLDQIHRLRHTKMKVTLINRYSSVLGEYLMRSYDMDDVCETPPREPSYSLPCNGENSPLVSVSATPIEREQAMVVVEEGISPQKLVYDVKCMFCGIRRCLHFLASTALYAVLCSLILFLRGVAVQNIVIPALLIYPALVCVCYYLIETVRNCNQYTRSLVLGAFCGMAGVVAAAVGLNIAPFTYMLSVFFLALYLFFARKPFSFSVKDGALLGACLAVAVLPWFFLGGNWLPAAIMALYPAAAAFILDRFY
jgi:hypothetical protein